MTDRDRKEFSKILIALGEMFDQAVSESRLEGYFETLQDYSLDEVRAAAARLRSSERFFPKPVDFIDALRGSPNDRSELTWNLLLKCIAKGGSWTSFVTNDGALAATLTDLWGTWDELCRVVGREDSVEMLAHWRNRFGLVYRMQLKREHKAQVYYFPCQNTVQNRLSQGEWRDGVVFDAGQEKCIALVSGEVRRDVPVRVDERGHVLLGKHQAQLTAGAV